ncbi:hypothetical protein Taro_055527 [Colocasia esculenta]|uniref:Uncharacterized protein n=1 Tax=Colocasia esculenta TaxID=4460 RepID=A0A843XT80_COLES|nr:hypothetical protein [Colocasia esculenta]
MWPQFGIGTPRRSTERWFRGIPFRGQNSPRSVRIAAGRNTRSQPITVIRSRVQLSSRSPPEVVDLGARTSPI